MIEFLNRHKFLELAKDMTDHPENYGGDEKAELRRTIISNLDHMKYDDFHDKAFDLPKSKMNEDFEALGRYDIAEAVRDGEYDQ